MEAQRRSITLTGLQDREAAEQGFKPNPSVLKLRLGTIMLYCLTKMRIKMKEPQREIKTQRKKSEFFKQHQSNPVLKLEDFQVLQCDKLGKDTSDTKSFGNFIPPRGFNYPILSISILTLMTSQDIKYFHLPNDKNHSSQ